MTKPGWMMVFLLAGAFVQLARGADPDPETEAAASDDAPAGPYSLSPIRLEMGGYSSHATNGLGTWSGGLVQLWYRNRYFTPSFTVDRQTRPTGTQWNYNFFSYLNWSKSFYTIQGYSWAPQKDPNAVYFPKRRYDVRGYWKLPPEQKFLIGIGYTRFDMGATGHGQIFSVGSLYYHGKWVLDGNLFVNRSQPGDLYSLSGLFSAQYGQEGHQWLGVTAGGGRELYQYVGQTPFEVRFMSYSLSAFYRRWLNKHTGIVFSGEYQDTLDAYRRGGGSVHLFFEF